LILDADEDVDYRLGRETRDGRASDMVDTAHRPTADRSLEELPFLVEARRPGSVVGHQLDGFGLRGSSACQPDCSHRS
jgi:hypothetical protein